VLRAFKWFGVIIATVILALAGFVAWNLYPHNNPQSLPAPLLSHSSNKGAARLKRSTAIADYSTLAGSFQAQELASYCGVASSVAVLGAFGGTTSQSDFFTKEASKVRSRLQVTFGGMTLAELAGLLRSYSLSVEVRHADEFDVSEFRRVVKTNLSSANDYLLVNYQREVLGQGRAGHISPLSAYDEATDSVLIMDTAAHKYPPTWVPLESLYAAMRTGDSSSGKLRGFLEVAR
jgi:hypothetical protein